MREVWGWSAADVTNYQRVNSRVDRPDVPVSRVRPVLYWSYFFRR